MRYPRFKLEGEGANITGEERHFTVSDRKARRREGDREGAGVLPLDSRSIG